MVLDSERAHNQEVTEWENSKDCEQQQTKRVFKTYTDYLAAPNPRHLYSQYETREKLGVVPRAALRAKASKRIQCLAVPRSHPASLDSWEGSSSVDPATLKFKITERLNELAVPSPRLLGACLKEYGPLLSDNQKETLEERIKEGEKLARKIHDKYRIREHQSELNWRASSVSLVSKTSRASTRGAKGARGKGWDHQRIEILAKPVFHAPPIYLKRGKKIPLPKLMRRIKSLCIPSPRYEGAQRAKEWKFTPEMKNFKASERLNALSKPILRPNIHINLEPGVSVAAKSYKASERTKTLALPKRKAKEPDTELRENPFSVSPLALQAKCTQRLKELSTPVKRDVKK